MKLLVIGHALVVDANRKFWSSYAEVTGDSVELVAPRRWRSNLHPVLAFQANPLTDGKLAAVHAVDTILPGNGSLFWFNPWQMARLWRDQRYDAVYVNQETWALSTAVLLVGKFFSPNRRTPLLLCVAQNLRKQRLHWLHPFERWVSSGVDRFLYCSEGVADVLRWKGIRRPMSYFPLPYDERATPSSPRQPSATVMTLGYLGRLTPDKGLHVLLAALERLNRDGEKFRLLVAGGGEMAPLLQSRSDVEFLGLLPHSEAHHFYQRIDCFVLPSLTRPHWKEQFGRVIVEAFGAGTPVVGSDSGSIPEVLGALQWPWTYPEASVEALAETLLRLRTFLGTAEGAAALAQAVVRNRELFSQRAVALGLRRVIEETLGHGPRTTDS